MTSAWVPPNNALRLPPEPFNARFLSRLLRGLPHLLLQQPRQILGRKLA